jgi:hypothetical protein
MRRQGEINLALHQREHGQETMPNFPDRHVGVPRRWAKVQADHAGTTAT